MEGRDTFSHLYSARRISVSSFYMQKYEVSVADYMEFCHQTHDPDNLPDTTVFDDILYLGEKNNYFSDARYLNYPVVGVSQVQAMRYIAWKEARINEQLKTGPYTVRFRLPTEKELEYVSISQEPQGSIQDGKYQMKEMGKWNTGPTFSQEGIMLKPWNSDGYSHLAPVNALGADAFGLYHIRGNASEWTLDRVSGRLEVLPNRNPFRSTYNRYDYYEMTGPGYVWLNDTCVVAVYKDTSTAGDTLCFSSREAEVLKDTNYSVTTGGSWRHSLFYAQPGVFLPVKQTEQHNWLGFRMVMYVYRNDEGLIK
jgi:formylglycine-generating enzyme required for sulfatase activity